MVDGVISSMDSYIYKASRKARKNRFMDRSILRRATTGHHLIGKREIIIPLPVSVMEREPHLGWPSSCGASRTRSHLVLSGMGVQHASSRPSAIMMASYKDASGSRYNMNYLLFHKHTVHFMPVSVFKAWRRSCLYVTSVPVM
jgi:hypothetical protein